MLAKQSVPADGKAVAHGCADEHGGEEPAAHIPCLKSKQTEQEVCDGG